MSDAVAEQLNPAHLGTEVLAGHRAMWEGGVKPVSPEILVTTAEEVGPEPKRKRCDDPASRYDAASLLQTGYRIDDLPDPIRPQNAEICEPGVLDRRLRLTGAQGAIYRVAHQDLEVVDEPKRSHAEGGVPLVEPHGRGMIPSARNAKTVVARLG